MEDDAPVFDARQRAGAAAWPDRLAIGRYLTAGVDNGYVERACSGRKPEDRANDDRRDEAHGDEHKRLDAL